MWIAGNASKQVGLQPRGVPFQIGLISGALATRYLLDFKATHGSCSCIEVAARATLINFFFDAINQKRSLCPRNMERLN